MCREAGYNTAVPARAHAHDTAGPGHDTVGPGCDTVGGLGHDTARLPTIHPGVRTPGRACAHLGVLLGCRLCTCCTQLVFDPV